MNTRIVNILGEEYTINTDVSTSEDDSLERMAGYCDYSVKSIVVAKLEKLQDSLKDLKVYENKIIRHEVIHAFLKESGLAENTDWATNEEMVDYFAIQFPKMLKVFKELGVV